MEVYSCGDNYKGTTINRKLNSKGLSGNDNLTTIYGNRLDTTARYCVKFSFPDSPLFDTVGSLVRTFPGITVRKGIPIPNPSYLITVVVGLFGSVCL